jgi:hypothetical protein
VRGVGRRRPEDLSEGDGDSSEGNKKACGRLSCYLQEGTCRDANRSWRSLGAFGILVKEIDRLFTEG